MYKIKNKKEEKEVQEKKALKTELDMVINKQILFYTCNVFSKPLYATMFYFHVLLLIDRLIDDYSVTYLFIYYLNN